MIFNRLTALRRIAKSLALRIPAFRKMSDELRTYRHAFRFASPGHFYSPIPSDEDLMDIHRTSGRPPRVIPGIDLNESRQLAMLSEIKRFYRDLPFSAQKTSSCRYFYENPFYSYSDAICLYGILRHARPERIVEIGSGYSSCVMLDTIDLHLDGRVACTLIEPYADRLRSLLEPGDLERVTILEQRVQDVNLDPFLKLNRNDILFIDSSHVVKVGSDVNYLLGEVLPRLHEGVYIHFHDIFYPFEYPEVWLAEGRVWSEAYALRAFLAFNHTFEIVLFNTYLEHFHREIFKREMPLCLKDEGGSIWLQKVR